MIRRLLVTAAVAALAACNPPEQAEPQPQPPAETPPPSAEAPGANVLTAQGFGPLRIGMTRAEVEAALGADANPNAVGGADPEACDLFRPARAPEGMLVMLEQGVLTSVWVARNTEVKTDRGLGVGDTAERVRQVYGTSVTAEPHKYVDAPAAYLTAWTTADQTSAAARGVKYEIGQDGKVTRIGVGGPSIGYVEGCS
ncbi:MAG TPA: hypothetical protein PLQ03_13645 [Brevundimonas sp.]|uniref:hypothetical protein n=1 Tax=Brevundimonas sp. TaxID=1871086 RepID=UPI00260245DC|nr:hypothetical protein [Brevundimonas sp.]HRO34441.1 hypothetical protein [Brevundimonas sp.]